MNKRVAIKVVKRWWIDPLAYTAKQAHQAMDVIRARSARGVVIDIRGPDMRPDKAADAHWRRIMDRYGDRYCGVTLWSHVREWTEAAYTPSTALHRATDSLCARTGNCWCGRFCREPDGKVCDSLTHPIYGPEPLLTDVPPFDGEF